MKHKIGYAIVDVTTGRADMARRVVAGQRFPVTVTGFITHQSSRDDGTSIEFGMKVSGFQIGSPISEEDVAIAEQQIGVKP